MISGCSYYISISIHILYSYHIFDFSVYSSTWCTHTLIHFVTCCLFSPPTCHTYDMDSLTYEAVASFVNCMVVPCKLQWNAGVAGVGRPFGLQLYHQYILGLLAEGCSAMLLNWAIHGSNWTGTRLDRKRTLWSNDRTEIQRFDFHLLLGSTQSSVGVLQQVLRAAVGGQTLRAVISILSISGWIMTTGPSLLLQPQQLYYHIYYPYKLAMHGTSSQPTRYRAQAAPLAPGETDRRSWGRHSRWFIRSSTRI